MKTIASLTAELTRNGYEVAGRFQPPEPGWRGYVMVIGSDRDLPTFGTGDTEEAALDDACFQLGIPDGEDAA